MPERLLVGCARGCVMVGVLLAMSDTLLPPLTSSTAWTEASHMRVLAVYIAHSIIWRAHPTCGIAASTYDVRKVRLAAVT